MDQETKKLYELQAEIIQAVSHPIRLAIIDYLSSGDKCVCDIATHVEANRSNVSRHLAILLRAGVLQCRKDGLRVIYSLRTPCVRNFLMCVNHTLYEKMENNATLLSKLAESQKSPE